MDPLSLIIGFSEGGIGFENVRDLHSDLSFAMARHSL